MARASEADKARARGRYRTDPAFRIRSWERHLKNRYGTTVEVYAHFFNDQEGLCAACHEVLTAPHLDHDHETGELRGLLCSPCNRTVGHAKEEPKRLLAVAHYLLEVCHR